MDHGNSRAFYDLVSLLVTVLRSPPGSGPPPPGDRAVAWSEQLTPATLASFLFGASLTLMLCGSLTFVIGFMLMPWILGLVILFHFVGILSSLSRFGRSMICPNSSSGSKRPLLLQGSHHLGWREARNFMTDGDL